MRQLNLKCLAVILFTGVSMLQAAGIMFVGSDIDGGAASWQTASVIKPLDADGDNIYGSWAAVHWKVIGKYSDNTIVYVGSGSQYKNSGYPMIDNLANPATDTEAAIALNQHTFRIGTAPPTIIRVGVMHDCLSQAENAADKPMGMRLKLNSDPDHVFAECMTVQANWNPDIYFFDIYDAQPGEIYTLECFNVGDRTQIPHLGPMTWDAGNEQLRAYGPAPDHRAVDIPVSASVILSWTTADDPNHPGQSNPAVTGHWVYLGEDPAILVLQGGKLALETNQLEVTLDKDKTYYWRVDEALDDQGDPNQVITGYTWEFATEKTLPQIIAQPRGISVAAGRDAAFAVEAIDPLARTLTYQWRYDPNEAVSGDEVDLTQTSSGYSGADSAELTVLAIDDADAGSYYCVVSNGNLIETQKAYLIIGKLVGHWPLDGSLDDIAGGNNAGASGSVRYGDGLINGAQACDFTASDALTIAAGAYTDPDWSLSWWDYALPGGDDWQAMLASGPTDGWEVFEFVRRGDSRYSFGFDNDNYYTTGYYVAQQQWHHHVMTYDSVTHTANWYLDGVWATERVSVEFAGGFDSLIYIGNVRGGTEHFSGSFDDLRFFNYPLDKIEIAQLYTDVRTGEFVCLEAIEGDFNQDCRIDLIDYALFVSEWLDCNRYPAGECD